MRPITYILKNLHALGQAIISNSPNPAQGGFQMANCWSYFWMPPDITIANCDQSQAVLANRHW